MLCSLHTLVQTATNSQLLLLPCCYAKSAHPHTTTSFNNACAIVWRGATKHQIGMRTQAGGSRTDPRQKNASNTSRLEHSPASVNADHRRAATRERQ